MIDTAPNGNLNQAARSHKGEVGSEPTRPEAGKLDAAAVYLRIHAEIATTDDISFKLLGLVPLVSGAGLVGVLFSKDAFALAAAQGLSAPGGMAITTLCLLAAAVTLGLLRWELRNVQTCNWLILRAKALEEIGLSGFGLSAAFFGRPLAPNRIGKESAEKLVYGATAAAWLVMPFAIDALSNVSAAWQAFFLICAVLVGGLTLFSVLFARASVPAHPFFEPETKQLSSERG